MEQRIILNDDRLCNTVEDNQQMKASLGPLTLGKLQFVVFKYASYNYYFRRTENFNNF